MYSFILITMFFWDFQPIFSDHIEKKLVKNNWHQFQLYKCRMFQVYRPVPESASGKNYLFDVLLNLYWHQKKPAVKKLPLWCIVKFILTSEKTCSQRSCKIHFQNQQPLYVSALKHKAIRGKFGNHIYRTLQMATSSDFHCTSADVS